MSNAVEESPGQQEQEQEANNRQGNAHKTNGLNSPVIAESSNTENGSTEDSLRCILHPWGVVDYHLYLTMVEKTSFRERRNRMYFISENGCYPVSERNIFHSQHFGPEGIQQNLKLLFNILPIPLNSRSGRVFGTRECVLGFDYNSRTFFARHFNPLPSPEHLWESWDAGTDMHSVSLVSLHELMRKYFTGVHEAKTGILSSSPNSRSLRGDHPGFEIVIAILFAQWLVDMADLLFSADSEEGAIGNAMYEVQELVEACRLVLQRASWRAWFAFRDGVSAAEYSRRLAIERMISNLYWFA